MNESAARCAGIAIAAFLLSAANAQRTPAPETDFYAPRGGKVGSETTVVFERRRIDDQAEVLFFRDGITVEDVIGPPGPTAEMKVFRVAKDAAPGIYPFCLAGKGGTSSIMLFFVGDLSETDEIDGGASFASAQTVVMESTINGILDGDDVDYFAVDCPADVPINFEVVCVRLGGRPVDTEMTIYDAEKRPLATCGDSRLGRMDPIIRTKFDRPTRVFVEVKRQHALGQVRDPYRLSIGRFPRPEGVHPVGGREGTTIRLDVDGGGAPVEINLPQSGESFAWFPKNEFGTAPSPVLLAVGPQRSYVEKDGGLLDEDGTIIRPADEKSPPMIIAPCAVHGCIDRPGAIDRFVAKLEKGAVYELKVIARAVRSALDPVLEVRGAKGRSVGRNDDAGGPDSALRFVVPETGEFTFEVKDMLGGGGDEYRYRLEIGARGEQPELTFIAPRGFTEFGAAVPRGQAAGFVLRARGVDPAAKRSIVIDDLPKGVTAEIGPISEATNLVPVLLRAAADYAGGAFLASPKLILEKGGEKTVVPLTQDVTTVEVENRRIYAQTRLDRLPIAVGDPAPFSISVATPKVPLVKGSRIELSIDITREAAKETGMTMRVLWLPPGITASNSRVDRTQTSVTLTLNAEAGATEGEWLIPITAVADGQNQRSIAGAFLPIKVTAPLVVAKLGKSRVEIGGTAEMPLSIDVKTPFSGTIVPEVVGLPRGVSLEPTTIDRSTTSTTLRFKVAADADPAFARNLLLRLAVPTADGPILHESRSGEIRIDAPLAPRPPEAPAVDPSVRGTVLKPKT